MSRPLESILSAIGNTPVIKINKLSPEDLQVTRELVAELVTADFDGCVLSLAALRMQTDDRQSVGSQLAFLVHNGLLTVDFLVDDSQNCVVCVPNEEVQPPSPSLIFVSASGSVPLLLRGRV